MIPIANHRLQHSNGSSRNQQSYPQQQQQWYPQNEQHQQFSQQQRPQQQYFQQQQRQHEQYHPYYPEIYPDSAHHPAMEQQHVAVVRPYVPPARRRPEDPPAAVAMKSSSVVASGIQLSSRQLELLAQRQKPQIEHQQSQHQERPFQTRSNVLMPLVQVQQSPWEQPFAPSSNGGGNTARTTKATRGTNTITQLQPQPTANLSAVEPKVQSPQAETLETQRAFVRSVMMQKAAAAIKISSTRSTSTNSTASTRHKRPELLLRAVLEKAAKNTTTTATSNTPSLQKQWRNRKHKSTAAATAPEDAAVTKTERQPQRTLTKREPAVAKKQSRTSVAATTTAAPASTATIDNSSNGFNFFFQTLIKEVSTQHSHLYASFHQLVESTEYPTEIVTTPKGREKVKFDKATTELLEMLVAHLRKKVDFQYKSQLVNDKQYQVEQPKRVDTAIREKESKMRQRESGQSERVVAAADSTPVPHVERISSARLSKTASDEQSVANDAILNTRSSSDDTASSADPVLSLRRSSCSFDKGAAADVLSERTEVENSALPSPPIDDTRKHRPQLSVVIPTAVAPPLQVGLQGHCVDDSSSQQPTKPPLSKQSSSSGHSPGPSSTSSVPWIGVQLRSVKNEFVESNSAKFPTIPWPNVTLRPVVACQKGGDDDENSTSDKIGSRHSPSSSLDFESENRDEIESEGVEPTNEIEEQLGPEQRGDTTLDEAIAVIRLKRDPTEIDSNEARIIVGKKMIQQIQNEPGVARAVVIWKLPRDDVEHDGMTLNMPTFKVTLILKKGRGSRKVLCFESAEDCLRFATAFYNMLDTAIKEQVGGVEETPPLAEISDTASDVNSSVRMESLNDEEQIVLERYRELRQTKPAKDALTGTLHSGSSITKGDVLNPDEEQLLEKYRKMLSLSLPLGAVQHRMRLDGVAPRLYGLIALGAGNNAPPKIVSAGELPSSPISTFTATTVGEKSTDNLTEAEGKVVESYRIMLKKGVPADAVRHKLTRDQADIKIAAAVFANDETPEEHYVAADKAKTSTTGPQLSTEEEAIAEKYRKMLKLRIPADGVRHKMSQDQIDGKIVTVVLGDEPIFSGNISKDPMVIAKKMTSPVLSVEDESVASKYRKLLKLQVSKYAVLARMQKEGVNEKIIITVLGHSAAESKPSEEIKFSGSASTGSNLINLHWNAMEDVPAGSVWETSKNAAEPERSDINKLVELFQKKKPSLALKEKTKVDEASSALGKAKLLDLTRSNNISISLKAFKEFSNKELAEIIKYLDPTRKIRGERAQFIRDLLPTMPEIRIIETFSGSDDRLVPAELWFRSLRGIKRLERKAQVLRTMEMFTAEAAEVRGNLRLLAQVCRQVIASVKLQDLLGMVLRIGNVMNEGTRTGGAAGFRFDSLLRLTQTKTSDGKMTVLDFLVTVFVAKGERDTLYLASDFPDCHKASRLLISDLINEVKLLQESLQQCKSELADLERDQVPPIPKLANPSASVGADPRAQLFASILFRGELNSTTVAPLAQPKSITDGFAKREQFLAAVNDNKKDEKQKYDAGLFVSSNSPDSLDEAKFPVSSPKIENTLLGGMKRLRSFIESVEVSFSRLEKQRDEALEACRDLSKYCGESGGVGATTSLLDILSQFAKNVEDALKKHDEQLQSDARKQKAQEARETRSTPSNDSLQSADKKVGMSLVLLVNDVLKNANPRFKEDFKKGRVLCNPSDSLKAIYERERKVATSDGRKLDLVSAIREREESIDCEEIQRARTRFAGVHHLIPGSVSEILSCHLETLSAKQIEADQEISPSTFNSDELSDRQGSTLEIPVQALSVKERSLQFSVAANQHSLQEQFVPRPKVLATKWVAQTSRKSDQVMSENSITSEARETKLSNPSNPLPDGKILHAENAVTSSNLQPSNAEIKAAIKRDGIATKPRDLKTPKSKDASLEKQMDIQLRGKLAPAETIKPFNGTSTEKSYALTLLKSEECLPEKMEVHLEGNLGHAKSTIPCEEKESLLLESESEIGPSEKTGIHLEGKLALAQPLILFKDVTPEHAPLLNKNYESDIDLSETTGSQLEGKLALAKPTIMCKTAATEQTPLINFKSEKVYHSEQTGIHLEVKLAFAKPSTLCKDVATEQLPLRESESKIDPSELMGIEWEEKLAPAKPSKDAATNLSSLMHSESEIDPSEQMRMQFEGKLPSATTPTVSEDAATKGLPPMSETDPSEHIGTQWEEQLAPPDTKSCATQLTLNASSCPNDLSFDTSSSRERLNSKRSRTYSGSLADVMKALESISKDTIKNGHELMGGNILTTPLPSQPSTSKKSLCDRAREKRNEKSIGAVLTSRKQKQSSLPKSLFVTPPQAPTYSPLDTGDSINNESSTARLARMKRLQKHLSR